MIMAHLAAGLLLAQVPPPAPPARFVPPPHRARANMAGVISDGDYPPESIFNREQGEVAFELEVGPDGRASRCAITGSSGSEALDQATCRIMRARLRFVPATDEEGRPVRDIVRSRLRWALPDPVPGSPPQATVASRLTDADYPPEALARREQGTAVIILSISATGDVKDCAVFASSGSQALDAATCRIARERARFRPGRDAAGNPVPDRLMQRVRWTLPG